MISGKKTYSEMLKNHSAALNPKLTAVPLIPKPPRVRLTEQAKKNLRAIMKDEPTMNNGKPTNPVVASHERVKSLMELTQPLVLASASAGILPSFVLDNRRFMQSSVNSAAVHLLNPNEIQNTVREGNKENPIDVGDDSEDENVEAETGTSVDHYSVDGVTVAVKPSDFDASEFINEVADEVADEQTNSRPDESRKETVELDRMLRVEGTKALRKAKRRMEEVFMNDYAVKIKPMKREYRDEYECEYNFIVKLGVVDNTVEVKDTVTYCKITQLETETKKTDEDYEPDDDDDNSVIDVDEKKQSSSRSGQSVFFDPEKQSTKYNKKRLPTIIPVIEINEKPSETREYHWLAKYESVPSNSRFNSFLNNFKMRGQSPNFVQEFEGVRYRYLRVGTNSKLNTVRQYNQFVIGKNFSIFRLGVNGSPNVDLGVCANTRERRFPLPINKKFTIASLFWANELLNSQKAW